MTDDNGSRRVFKYLTHAGFHGVVISNGGLLLLEHSSILNFEICNFSNISNFSIFNIVILNVSISSFSYVHIAKYMGGLCKYFKYINKYFNIIHQIYMFYMNLSFVSPKNVNALSPKMSCSVFASNPASRVVFPGVSSPRGKG